MLLAQVKVDAVQSVLLLASLNVNVPGPDRSCEDEDDPRLVKRPCVLVEVLSKSTEDIDLARAK